jgi:hypothetical protein
MMTKTVLGLAFLGASFLLGGCGCDPGNNSQRTPVTFDPSSSSATRDACGTYTLKLLGDTTVAPPYTLIELDLAPSAAVGQEIPLWVGESGSAHSSDGSVAFSLQAGSSLDATPLASVVVTPNALPKIAGAALEVELQLTFEDGRVLDQVYTAPVQTSQAPCGI